jgi:hypothetical protein
MAHPGLHGRGLALARRGASFPGGFQSGRSLARRGFARSREVRLLDAMRASSSCLRYGLRYVARYRRVPSDPAPSAFHLPRPRLRAPRSRCCRRHGQRRPQPPPGFEMLAACAEVC